MPDGKLIFDTKIDESGFETGLTNLGTKTNNVTGSVIKGILGSNIIQKAGAALLDFAGNSLTAASDLQEVDNVVQVTFGDNAPLIDAFAKKATNSFGMTETAAKRYAGTFGSILKAMGMTDDQTLEFSQNLVGLAADLASFYNLDFETAYQKLRSGLVGETEPMMDLGIDLRVETMKEYAETLGLVYDEMSSTEQAALRYAAIMDKTGDVQGDFDRTSGSFANQMKIFESNISNLQTMLGKELLPVANSVLTFFTGLFAADEGELKITDQMADVTEQFEAFNIAAETAAANFATTEATIAARAELAETYLTTLETLESKEIKTDEDVAAINNAVVALNTLYPELKASVDPATGALSMNTQAIRDNIAALQDLALQNLFDEQMQTNAQNYALALDNLANAMITLDAAQAPLAEVEEKMRGVEEVLRQLEESSYTGIDSYAGQFASLIPNFDEYFTQNLDGSWTAVDPSTVNAQAIVAGAEAALVSLDGEREAITEGIAETQEAVDGYKQTIADIETEQAEIAAKQQKVKELWASGGKDAADSTASGIEENADAVADAMQGAVDSAAENVDTTEAYNAGYAAQSALAQGAKDGPLARLRLKTPTVSTSGVDGSHASGLNYVPYNDYVARLHVGEAVLTASEARAWRGGEGISGSEPAPAYAAPHVTEINLDGRRIAEIQGYSNSAQIALDNQKIARGVGSR